MESNEHSALPAFKVIGDKACSDNKDSFNEEGLRFSFVRDQPLNNSLLKLGDSLVWLQISQTLTQFETGGLGEVGNVTVTRLRMIFQQ